MILTYLVFKELFLLFLPHLEFEGRLVLGRLPRFRRRGPYRGRPGSLIHRRRAALNTRQHPYQYPIYITCISSILIIHIDINHHSSFFKIQELSVFNGKLHWKRAVLPTLLSFGKNISINIIILITHQIDNTDINTHYQQHWYQYHLSTTSTSVIIDNID